MKEKQKKKYDLLECRACDKSNNKKYGKNNISAPVCALMWAFHMILCTET